MVDPIEIRITGEDDSSKAIASAEGGLKSLETTAKGSAQALEGVGSKVQKTTKVVGEGGRAFGDYGTGLGGVGDRMDEVDTRSMGLADGITGVTDLMKGPGTLGPAGMAMAMSDLGSSMYNFVIPQMQSTVKGAGSLIDKLGGIKGAAMGAAGIAGMGALIFAAKELEAANQAKVLDEMAEGFKSVHYEATAAAKEAIRNVESIGLLDEAFQKAEASGGKDAERLIDLAEAAGISKDVIAEYRKEIEQKTAADEDSTEAEKEATSASQERADAIRGVSDALRAQVDPQFGMIEALESNRDAQTAVNDAQAAYLEAVKEHGRGSEEATDALRDLNSAQDDAVKSAFDYEAAAADLQAQIAEHPATLSNARLALQRWVAQGLITEDQAKRMAVRFENAADKADEIQGSRRATLTADDRATGVVRPLANRLDQLDGRNVTFHLGAQVGSEVGHYLSLIAQAGGRAAGGPTAAGGGPRGPGTLMHEYGPEVTFHPDGSMVIPAGASRGIMAAAAQQMGGGGGRITIDLTGGDEMFMRWLRTRISADGGDVQAVLGQR